MTKKYFFFDIDGTLTTENPGGIILPSTMEAIEKLKENGHFVAIATGRSYRHAVEFQKMMGLSNMVHDGGYGVTINNQLIDIMPLNREKALAICLECKQKNIPFCVLSNTKGICVSHNDAFLKGGEQYTSFFSLEVIDNLDYHTLDCFYKIFISIEPEQESQIESLSLLGHSRYFEHHINVEPDDKAVGIKKMMEYMNASLEDIVVFGDGHNDLTMFQLAKTSIAMGNAIDELKEIATYVTKRSDEGGIEDACRHFKWID